MDPIMYMNFIYSSVDLAFDIIFNSSEVKENLRIRKAYTFLKERYGENLKSKLILDYLESKNNNEEFKIPTIEDIIYIINELGKKTGSTFKPKTKMDFYIIKLDENNKLLQEFMTSLY